MTQAQEAASTAFAPSRPQHATSSRLENQAALAALYTTKHDSVPRDKYEFLDGNNRLSSAGAAASLKYANPQDLPSYPSAGLRNNDSAAGAAASLGWANQKTFEHWKPDASSSASAAAFHARDYKMAPLWQPEQSSHGAKAAVLAHRDSGKVDVWRPEVTSWGNSAAAQAFKKYGTEGSFPKVDYGYTALGRQGSLMAATGAMSTSRKRSESTPVLPLKVEAYPDEANAVANALSAAASAHNSKIRGNVLPEGGSSPYTNMAREMYTSHPPVAPEIEEQNRKDVLHASAVAMAKKMYTIQQKQIDAATDAQRGAIAASGRRLSTSSVDDGPAPMRFNNLQEAAQRLAQERLAKLHDEHSKNREYRDYYGSNSKSSRLSIRGRTRRRASSDGGLDEDREQSNKIRAQMSLFSNNLSQVDSKKRKQDREALLAAAQRNVTKSLHGMDERVFADTGKVAPSLLNNWELRAHTAAQAKSDTRMENYGKVDIGGGKFMNQSEVNLVAARNVQPVLDEINEKAELQRARQVELKLEQENAKRKADGKKTREKEEKDINRKLKQQDKEEEKSRRAEEKAVREGEKRMEKEKRKSLKTGAVDTEPVLPVQPRSPTLPVEETNEPLAPDLIAERREVSTPAAIRTSMEDQASLRIQENANAANKDEVTPVPPASPTKDGGKVKSWLKSQFSRRTNRSQKPVSAEKEVDKSNGFIGGAAFTGASASNTTPSIGTKVLSVKDGAASTSSVNKPSQAETGEGVDRSSKASSKRHSQTSQVSSMSAETGDEDEEFQEARDNFNQDLAPPPTFPAQKSSSPARSARFKEEI